MIRLLNRKLRGLVYIVFILVAISFIFFVDFLPSGNRGQSAMGTIRGKNIQREEFETHFRETEIAFFLTTGQMAAQLPGMDELLYQETWNRLITLQAAQRAGVQVSSDDITGFVTSNPLFQREGKFDPSLFQQFSSLFFDPPGVNLSRGMNLENFEKAVKNHLTIERFNHLLQSGSIISTTETDSLLQRLHGEATVEVASLSKSSVASEVKPTEDEIQAYYQASIQKYQTPEKRRVDYVLFPLSPGMDSAQAKRMAGESALNFSDPFYRAYQEGKTAPSFAEQAAAAGLKINTTPWLQQESSPDNLTGGEILLRATFQLSPEQPVSDAIETKDGFLVIHLAEVQAPSPIPLEQITAKVREDFRLQEVDRRFEQNARIYSNVLARQITSGVTWKDAIREAGLTAGKSMTLVPSATMRHADPLTQLAARTVSALETGKVSQPSPIEDTAYIFYITARQPVSAEVVELHRHNTQSQLVARQGAALVREWILSEYKAPGTRLPFDPMISE